jgi:L,D-transpeptidase ErfK/SrfK
MIMFYTIYIRPNASCSSAFNKRMDCTPLKKQESLGADMKVYISIIASVLALFLTIPAFAESMFYGARLCHDTANFACHRVRSGETWESLFSPREQDVVMRVNRIGIRLQPGMILAIPRNLDSVSAMDFSPFPHEISAPGERIVMVSLSQMAWGAYDSNGELVKWGPASSARGYCPDEHRSCNTVTGHFAIYNKEGPECKSRKFPIGRGGAPMPWCMYFHGGFALHGSYEVPGYNASHGCVRLFVDDAEWLSQDFTDIGTPVIVNH